jgi:hypothetical protein
VAEQGLGILKKLMSLVLSKEMERMLEFQDLDPEADHVLATVTPDVQTQIVEKPHIRPDPRTEPTPAQAELTPFRDGINATVDDFLQSRTTSALSHTRGGNSPSPAANAQGFGFDFCEDPMMAQALFDFDQGMANQSHQSCYSLPSSFSRYFEGKPVEAAR